MISVIPYRWPTDTVVVIIIDYVGEYRRDVWKQITAQLDQFQYVSVKEFERTPWSAILSMEWVTNCKVSLLP